ncbi:hypothetical protein COW36_20830 [bacterium (Candidatus Blackallbacteria) CG17_big_fil_post_rev_8_21_14_2_50_48_46]|uniref:Uncharacterized protein n=1 Tax=bacterium (Candidatus Blackallbacteria) CG17_big_fil_post_rev_8_21_14_2_50_48_46 TaxID=2014261 RepID=A0A2M7FYV8_9BACT|nr:MAG: hypothetical protein COW64_14140 [bacterium (Candidatus Blackallbacteria) CG18_big_fil_WC_8_21_14_2_50_49_26]PIW14488.1 MAG: hypothetical protein COW36_20830 [bacterium (Candidatus Blackallbacteria) CG17_big_fil_post_rev_8_21_14_2_50_48_46]PIW47174.1 MAG: hypothetical protein COW20_13275 [bacterium (Candidatus Blackallbacteria) CG13_big_fil_rev_8_21_14_2_50_49_14]
MSEFELLDFDDEPVQGTAGVDAYFWASARERRDFHQEALQQSDAQKWAALISQLDCLPDDLRQKLHAAFPALPELSLADAACLLESLQPLLPNLQTGDPALHLYHGVAAEHFLKFARS